MPAIRFRELEGRASGTPLVARVRFEGLTIDATSLERLMLSEPALAATLLLTLSRNLAERLEIASRALALLPPVNPPQALQPAAND